jgi:hypothetical protein
MQIGYSVMMQLMPFQNPGCSLENNTTISSRALGRLVRLLYAAIRLFWSVVQENSKRSYVYGNLLIGHSFSATDRF